MANEWYVLQTKPRKEALVAHQVGSQSAQVFFPRLVESSRLARSPEPRIAPMFPGYLFVNLDIREFGKGVRYTPGVKDFLRCDGEPEPISGDIVEVLMGRTGPSGIYEAPPLRLERGRRLRIEDGPLRGLEVIFEEELSGPERVAVLLAEVNLQARIVLSRRLLACA
jgi:transcriptional antiterminator RfaH